MAHAEFCEAEHPGESLIPQEGPPHGDSAGPFSFTQTEIFEWRVGCCPMLAAREVSAHL